MRKLKYIKLFESFDQFNLSNASQEDIFSKESFDYLCVCLNHIARAVTNESKFLPNKQPITNLLATLSEFGQYLGFKVNETGNNYDGDFKTRLEHAFEVLNAMNRFLNFTTKNVSKPAAKVNLSQIQPNNKVLFGLKEGHQLIENILDEFKLIWAGKVGQSTDLQSGGNVRASNIPGGSTDIGNGQIRKDDDDDFFNW